jgi:hypothetical protein
MMISRDYYYHFTWHMKKFISYHPQRVSENPLTIKWNETTSKQIPDQTLVNNLKDT